MIAKTLVEMKELEAVYVKATDELIYTTIINYCRERPCRKLRKNEQQLNLIVLVNWEADLEE